MTDGFEFKTQHRDLAALSARSFIRNFTPSLETEGAGKTGCALHPRSRVQCAQEVRTRAYRSSGEHPAFPAQWLYGLWRALPGEANSFATVTSRDNPAKLGASIGAPGPHAFAVRERPRSSVAAFASTASHRTFVTIAIAPLVG